MVRKGRGKVTRHFGHDDLSLCQPPEKKKATTNMTRSDASLNPTPPPREEAT